MPAYVIAEIEVTDPAGFDQYRAAVPATIAAHGGRYLCRGGAVEVVEGDRKPGRIAILQFDTMAQAKAWYASPEYRPLLELRRKTTISHLTFVEGLA
jgi:uncharacterized protein (DUF1330 family)